MGLSPRVRGNPISGNPDFAKRGTIPACAGEPFGQQSMAPEGGDYPRVCGGTCTCPPAKDGDLGLSPRVRGNATFAFSATSDAGTIPACAGEPSAASSAQSSCMDYPRVCGGTAPSATFEEITTGLSPRVRGNLGLGLENSARDGTIPACAGEPRW